VFFLWILDCDQCTNLINTIVPITFLEPDVDFDEQF